MNRSGYTLHQLSSSQYGEWNEAVLASSSASLFHTTHFYEAFGVFYVWVVKRHGRSIAGLIVAGGSRLTGRPAFVPYTGFVIFDDAPNYSGHYACVHESYKLLGPVLLDMFAKVNIRLAPQVQDIQQLIWLGFEVRLRYTYVIDLSELEAVYENFDSNIKRQIKKAESLGVVLSFSSDSAKYIEMFRATREHPDSHLELLSQYQKFLSRERLSTTVVVSDANGLTLAAVLVVWDSNRAYYLLGGYRKSSENDNRSYTAFALWQAMKYVHEQVGVKEFDLEGSMIPGVENFFRKFGGRKVPYFELTYERRDFRYFIHRIRQKILK